MPPNMMHPYPPGTIPLQEMPEYQSGRRRRLAGILVTSIGSGVSLVVISMSALANLMCWDSGCKDDGASLVIGGLIGLGVSCAVGIPLWVSGHRMVKRARLHWSQQLTSSLGLAPTPGGLQVSSRWRF